MRAKVAVLSMIVALLLGGYLVTDYFVVSQASVKTTVTTVTTSVTAASTATSTVTFGNLIIFNYSTMPPQFFVGNYLVRTAQGVNYTIVTNTGGTVRTYDYSGFYTLFDFFPLNGGLEYQTLFVWNTTSGPSTSHLPYEGMCFVVRNQSSGCPSSAITPNGRISVIWTERDSTFWVSFTFK